MHTANAESWELRSEVPDEPHIALFVRDALELQIPSTMCEPLPPLEGEIPDLRVLVTEEEREKFGLAYPDWWGSSFRGAALLAAHRGRNHPAAFHRELQAASARFYEPLTSHVQLRQKAAAWLVEHRKPHVRRPPDSRRRDWEIARDAVEAAATDLGVAPGELRANTSLLLVQCIWYATPAPGCLLYSPAVRDDARLFGEVLRDAFASSFGS
jgi:hypothetical protein